MQHLESVSGEELQTLDGLSRALGLISSFVENGPMLLSALAYAMCDVLRECPIEERGQVLDIILRRIRSDVHASMD